MISSSSLNGLHIRSRLNADELAAIDILAQRCNSYEQLHLKLNRDMLNTRPGTQADDYLYYQDGLLVGYLGLYTFNSNEAEMNGMVAPEQRGKGIFQALFAAVSAELQRRGIPKLILICEHTSQSGNRFVAALGGQYSFSEYRMELAEAREIPAAYKYPQLELHRATSKDRAIQNHILAVCFGMPEENLAQVNSPPNSDQQRSYIAGLAGIPIGTIHTVLYGDHHSHIYGFGVLPTYRGRGYGRQILAMTIKEIMAVGRTHIALEVETKNRNALGLYQSCGFVETAVYDYYACEV